MSLVDSPWNKRSLLGHKAIIFSHILSDVIVVPRTSAIFIGILLSIPVWLKLYFSLIIGVIFRDIRCILSSRNGIHNHIAYSVVYTIVLLNLPFDNVISIITQSGCLIFSALFRQIFISKPVSLLYRRFTINTFFYKQFNRL